MREDPAAHAKAKAGKLPKTKPIEGDKRKRPPAAQAKPAKPRVPTEPYLNRQGYVMRRPVESDQPAPIEALLRLQLALPADSTRIQGMVDGPAIL
jgi:hypothetical protein